MAFDPCETCTADMITEFWFRDSRLEIPLFAECENDIVYLSWFTDFFKGMGYADNLQMSEDYGRT